MRIFSFTSSCRLIFALGLLYIALPDAARGDTDLRSQLETVAKSLTRLLESTDENAIAIGQFTGPPNFPTSAGTGLVETLTEEFEKLGIKVTTRANIGLKGELSAAKVRRPDPADPFKTREVLAVRLTGTLVDQFGTVLTDFDLKEDIASGEDVTEVERGQFTEEIEGEENFVQLIGTTVSLPVTADSQDRSESLQASFVDPEDPGNVRIVSNTQLYAGVESPYGIEILAGPKPVSGEPELTSAEVKLDDGLPHVELSRGEVYQVRLLNDSDYDAAAKLTIDGISVFAFSDVKHEDGPQEGQPKYSFYMVPARSSLTLKGWHRTNEQVDSFLITSYETSAAARLGHSSNLGTLTATFAAAWEGEDRPADEPATKKNADTTGFGPPLSQKVQEVRRQTGVLRAAVTVRYSKEA